MAVEPALRLCHRVHVVRGEPAASKKKHHCYSSVMKSEACQFAACAFTDTDAFLVFR